MKKFWKRVRALVADNWQVGLASVVILGTVLVALTFHLATFVGGISESEKQLLGLIQTNAVTPELLLRNAQFLPYYVMIYLVQLSPFDGVIALRGIGVLFGLLGAIGFFYVLKKWYSARAALIGSVLFVSSSWFLHTSRFADPAAAYLLVPLLIAGVVALQSKARAPWMLLLVVLLGFTMIYVPGLLWFILPAVILQRRTISNSLLLQPIWFRVVLIFMALIMLTPLVATIVWPTPFMSSLNNTLGLLGLPTSLPNPIEYLKQAVRTVSDIFFYSTAGPLYGPGHLPWLDACASVLAALGIFQFLKHWRLDRTKLLLIVGIVGLALIATGGPVAIALLLPFIYLLSVEGLKWLLDMWLSVFPRNPVARTFGVTMAVVVVCAVAAYQIQKYYLAWAHSPETRQVFNHKP